MNRLILATAALVVTICGIVHAQGPVGKDLDKRPVYDFMPRSFGVLTATKADMTLSTAAVHAVRVQPSVAVTVKINGTGDAWPIAANAVQEYRIPDGVNSLVFSAASSASNKVYYQLE